MNKSESYLHQQVSEVLSFSCLNRKPTILGFFTDPNATHIAATISNDSYHYYQLDISNTFNVLGGSHPLIIKSTLEALLFSNSARARQYQELFTNLISKHFNIDSKAQAKIVSTSLWDKLPNDTRLNISTDFLISEEFQNLQYRKMEFDNIYVPISPTQAILITNDCSILESNISTGLSSLFSTFHTLKLLLESNILKTGGKLQMLNLLLQQFSKTYPVFIPSSLKLKVDCLGHKEVSNQYEYLKSKGILSQKNLDDLSIVFHFPLTINEQELNEVLEQLKEYFYVYHS